MSPEEKDPAHLWDMLEAARTVAAFVKGVPLEAYVVDLKLRLAVERGIEIIGEAARRISPGFPGRGSSLRGTSWLTTTERSTTRACGGWPSRTSPD